jgi:hypothetical protein
MWCSMLSRATYIHSEVNSIIEETSYKNSSFLIESLLLPEAAYVYFDWTE